MDSQHQCAGLRAAVQGLDRPTSVYPRVVVQRALALNASALILAHQHPSGVTEPSAADRALTERLKAALAMVDVRVVDHFIVGEGAPYSFAEAGLL
jgi:DNA repair protein RadC